MPPSPVSWANPPRAAPWFIAASAFPRQRPEAHGRDVEQRHVVGPGAVRPADPDLRRRGGWLQGGRGVDEELVAHEVDVALGPERLLAEDALGPLVDRRPHDPVVRTPVEVALDEVLLQLGPDALQQEPQVPEDGVVAQDRVLALDHVAHGDPEQRPDHRHGPPTTRHPGRGSRRRPRGSGPAVSRGRRGLARGHGRSPPGSACVRRNSSARRRGARASHASTTTSSSSSTPIRSRRTRTAGVAVEVRDRDVDGRVVGDQRVLRGLVGDARPEQRAVGHLGVRGREVGPVPSAQRPLPHEALARDPPRRGAPVRGVLVGPGQRESEASHVLPGRHGRGA